MRYFSKAIPSRPLATPKGTPIVFEKIDDRQPGYLATEDGYLIAELESAIQRRVGGISRSTESEYTAFLNKKKALASLPPPPPQRGLSALNMQGRIPRNPVVPAAGAVNQPVQEKPPRIEIKTEFPKLGRYREPTT